MSPEIHTVCHRGSLNLFPQLVAQGWWKEDELSGNAHIDSLTSLEDTSINKTSSHRLNDVWENAQSMSETMVTKYCTTQLSIASIKSVVLLYYLISFFVCVHIPDSVILID